MTEAQQVAEVLERERQGTPVKEVWRGLYVAFGDEAPSDETVRQLHKGAIKHPDRLHLLMLASYYGIDISELSPGAARVLTLVGGGATDPGGPGGDSPESSDSGATMSGLPHSVADLPIGDVYREKRAS